MSGPEPAVGFVELASLIDRSIRSQEALTLLKGIEFTMYRKALIRGASKQAPFAYLAGGHGFELSCDADGTVKLVSFFGPGAQPDVRAYAETLPAGLTFQSSPEQVRRALGNPSISGPEQLVPNVGRVGPWDRFDRSTFSMHVQYNLRGRRIFVIQLLATDRIP